MRHAVLAAAAVGAGSSLIPATDAAAVGPVTNEADIAPVTRLAIRAHDRAIDRHVRLTRTSEKLGGLSDARTRREVRDWSLEHLRDANQTLKRKNRKLRRAAAAAGAAGNGGATTPAGLQSIAQCESGGDPSAVDASGTYRGKYQFDLQTWQSVGGTGDPAAAPEAVQDQMAARLMAQRGSSPWPVCGG